MIQYFQDIFQMIDLDWVRPTRDDKNRAVVEVAREDICLDCSTHDDELKLRALWEKIAKS